MGYLKIPNLYALPQFLVEFAGQEVAALEKIHGTSAHLRLAPDRTLSLFPGGCKYATLAPVFDLPPDRVPPKDHAWLPTFAEVFSLEELDQGIVVYGEAYGGKLQGMRTVYGPETRFVAFDVRVGERWLDVEDAAFCCGGLRIPFVPWKRVLCDVQALNAARDEPSALGKRLGVTDDGYGEGIVVRPLQERTMPNGNRWIAKHKREKFSEVATTRHLEDKAQRLLAGAAAAAEWVTPERLRHVLDKLEAQRAEVDKGKPWEPKDTPAVVRACLADVKAEAGPEVEWGKSTERELCTSAAKAFKKLCTALPS